MTTYLYGLTLSHSAAVVSGATGIAGAPVRGLSCGALTALVSTVSLDSARPTLDAVRAHDDVLQRSVDAGATVAAVRFGQTFPDDDACRTHVAERAERLTTLLEAARDAVEMRVLVPMSEGPARAPSPSTDAGPGRAYLESLRSSGAVAPDLGLRAALGPLVIAERVEGLPQTNGVAFVHLVKRASLAEYREALALLPVLADARVVGPLALYSFAEPAG